MFPTMRTTFLLLIALTGFSAAASSPLELNKRLGLTQPASTTLTAEQKLALIQRSIEGIWQARIIRR